MCQGRSLRLAGTDLSPHAPMPVDFFATHAHARVCADPKSFAPAPSHDSGLYASLKNRGKSKFILIDSRIRNYHPDQVRTVCLNRLIIYSRLSHDCDSSGILASSILLGNVVCGDHHCFQRR